MNDSFSSKLYTFSPAGVSLFPPHRKHSTVVRYLMKRVILILGSFSFLACNSNKLITNKPKSVSLYFSPTNEGAGIGTLSKGDTLSLKFQRPHGGDLAIRDPDSKLFFLVYAFSNAEKPSLVDWNKFKQMTEIKIITDKTKAAPWVDSIKTNQLIFSKPGLYEVQLSENLETDDGTPVEYRSVFYKDH
jgi:hypothetical protein